MNLKTAALEAQMLLEAKGIISKNRLALDLIDASTRKRISEILGYSEFGTDAWLVSACSYLDGKAPMDVLKLDSSKVIEAAIRKSNWRNPG